MANKETLTLTQIVNGIKDNSFKFERLKSDLALLAGLLDGAIIVKPRTDNDLQELIAFIKSETVRPKGFNSTEVVKHFDTVNTEMVKDLVNQLKETV